MAIKILGTLGPSSLNKETVQKLEQAGVNLFRINLSHAPLEDLGEVLWNLNNWTSVPICLDSEGAQVRNGSMLNGNIRFKKRNLIKIHSKAVVGDDLNISFTPSCVFPDLRIGDQIQVDFNSASFRILERHDDFLVAEIIEGGTVGSNKGAVVNRPLVLPAVTTKDKAAFELGLSMGIKNYALSFTHRASDVIEIRDIIGDLNLISKIESIEGVLNIKDILPLVDQILIDRGDLSREIPIAKIPFLQRSLITYARKYDTPVYVATNLLESMIESFSPTRAEANDVASTLLMGASGLVLAAETAIGKYPVEAVNMLTSIIQHYDNWTPETTFKELIDFE